MRQALQRRYRLLPYLYTAFYTASQTGTPVARSLIMEFAQQLMSDYSRVRAGKQHRRELFTYLSTDAQFMLGPGVFLCGDDDFPSLKRLLQEFSGVLMLNILEPISAQAE